MEIGEIARLTGGELIVRPPEEKVRIARLVASNTMSDLIANAGRDTLVLTTLNNSQLIRVAELMEVPCICLAASASPGPDLVAGVRACGAALLVSPLTFAEAQGRLQAALGASGGP